MAGSKIGSIGRMAAMALTALSLAGCVSLGGGDTPDQLISLTPDELAPAGEIGSGDLSEAIVVLDPEADRRLDVTRVPVQIDASSIAYVKDAVWVERPARQFRRLLAETIRARSGKVVVEGNNVDVVGKTFVSGRLIDMGYDAQIQSVVVRYDAIVEGEGGTVRSRRFEAEVPVVKADARSVAPALNEAANAVAGEVAEWLEGS